VILLLATALFAADPGVTLTIEVPNLRNTKGEIRAALFRSPEGFPRQVEQSFQRVVGQMNNATGAFTFKDVPPGNYAIVIVHDENRNGKLDTNLLGIPKEGYGFSRNAKGRLGPPSYDAARFTVGDTPLSLSISFNY
jgi:uncharacterized protein (DUF2141 family)